MRFDKFDPMQRILDRFVTVGSYCHHAMSPSSPHSEPSVETEKGHTSLESEQIELERGEHDIRPGEDVEEAEEEKAQRQGTSRREPQEINGVKCPTAKVTQGGSGLPPHHPMHPSQFCGDRYHPQAMWTLAGCFCIMVSGLCKVITCEKKLTWIKFCR